MKKRGKSMPKARPWIPEEDVQYLLEDFAAIMRSGRLTQGEYLERFEEEFADYVGTKFAVGLNSGTAPLEVALRYWQVQEREVVVPTNTFAASANAVILAGGTPVLAEMCTQSLCSGLREIREKVTPKTCGVMVVHIAGLVTSDMAIISRFCCDRGLFLLEDAAHAAGACWRGRKAGSLGDAASFSFFPTKVITCGEGGMLTTDLAELAAFARSFRCHGIAEEGRELVRLGANYRLPELSAALGLRQLRRLDDFVQERNSLAQFYLERLPHIPDLGFFPPSQEQVHAYYKFPVILPADCERKQVLQALKAEFGVIGGSIYWPPCHLQPYFRRQFGWGKGSFPVAEKVLSRTLTLPLYSGLKEDDLGYICSALAEVLGRSEVRRPEQNPIKP